MGSTLLLQSWTATVLIVALGAAGGWAWWRQRGTQGWRRAASARSAIVVLQRQQSQALTQHASVHAVRWNGEELLVACTPQQVTLLARSRRDPGADA